MTMIDKTKAMVAKRVLDGKEFHSYYLHNDHHEAIAIVKPHDEEAPFIIKFDQATGDGHNIETPDEKWVLRNKHRLAGWFGVLVRGGEFSIIHIEPFQSKEECEADLDAGGRWNNTYSVYIEAEF
jgi:hypothetical protein